MRNESGSKEVMLVKTILWVWDPNHYWPGAKGYPIKIANETQHQVITVDSINTAIDTIERRNDIVLVLTETFLPLGESFIEERVLPDAPHHHCTVIPMLDAISNSGLPIIIVSPTFVEEDRKLLEPRDEVKAIFTVPPHLDDLISAVQEALTLVPCAR